MNKRNLIPRIIASPFVLAILFITYLINCGKHFIRYLRYGGEWITYDKDSRVTIEMIYKELKEQGRT